MRFLHARATRDPRDLRRHPTDALSRPRSELRRISLLYRHTVRLERVNHGNAKVQTIRVSGEPPSFLTAPERAWKARIKEAIPQFQLPPEHGIRLLFVVTSWRRRGQFFDLDNIVKPVLDAISRPVASFVDAEVHLGQEARVEISIPTSPSRQVLPIVWLSDLPRASIRRPDAHPALQVVSSFGTDGFLRVHLHVHEPDLITNFDFTGFVKPTIDRLWPLLGGTARAPGDHRIKHLIITRSSERPSGVSIGVERLDTSW